MMKYIYLIFLFVYYPCANCQSTSENKWSLLYEHYRMYESNLLIGIIVEKNLIYISDTSSDIDSLQYFPLDSSSFLFKIVRKIDESMILEFMSSKYQGDVKFSGLTPHSVHLKCNFVEYNLNFNLKCEFNYPYDRDFLFYSKNYVDLILQVSHELEKILLTKCSDC